MKKIFKILIIFFAVFALSGCSVNYNVNIDNNGSVNDILTLEVLNQMTATYYNTPKEYLENMVRAKSDEYGAIGYNVDYKLEDDTSTAIMKGNYRSIDSYLNSGITKILFSQKDIRKDGDKTIVKLYGLNDIYNSFGTGDYYDFPEEFTITLNSKYVIENDNADEKNALTGVYKWHFKKGVIKKTIEFTITNKSSITANVIGSHPILSLIILVLAIFIIMIIIYGVVKGKIKKVNSI